MANMTFSEALEELMKDPDDMDACMNNNELPGFPEGWTLQIYHAGDPYPGRFYCMLVCPDSDDEYDERVGIESGHVVAFSEIVEKAEYILPAFRIDPQRLQWTV